MTFHKNSIPVTLWRGGAKGIAICCSKSHDVGNNDEDEQNEIPARSYFGFCPYCPRGSRPIDWD
jgi:hypothetical protein